MQQQIKLAENESLYILIIRRKIFFQIFYLFEACGKYLIYFFYGLNYITG